MHRKINYYHINPIYCNASRAHPILRTVIPVKWESIALVIIIFVSIPIRFVICMYLHYFPYQEKQFQLLCSIDVVHMHSLFLKAKCATIDQVRSWRVHALCFWWIHVALVNDREINLMLVIWSLLNFEY